MAIRYEDIGKIDLSDTIDPSTPRVPPTHPGEVLKEIVDEMNLSARALAREIGVPVTRITEILHGTRAVSAETAVLLGRRFGMTAEFWMNMQVHHDLEHARAHLGVAA